jgi:hypothetical protein
VLNALPVSGEPGDVVTYTYVVTNTGKLPLRQITVDDSEYGHIGDQSVLEPGEWVVFTKRTTLPSSAGLLTNVATVAGRHGNHATSDTDDETVTIVLAVHGLRPPGSPEQVPKGSTRPPVCGGRT